MMHNNDTHFKFGWCTYKKNKLRKIDVDINSEIFYLDINLETLDLDINLETLYLDICRALALPPLLPW